MSIETEGLTDEPLRERLDHLEPELREALADITEQLAEQRSLLTFLTNLKLGDAKQGQRIQMARRAAEHARSYLPKQGRQLATFDAERATAFATVALAESAVLLMEVVAKQGKANRL